VGILTVGLLGKAKQSLISMYCSLS